MQIAKNIANIALALLILASTTGITLHKHYCMGHLRNVALMHEAAPCNGEMEMPLDCCKDTVEEFKVEELNKASFSFDVSPELYLISFVGYVLYDVGLPAAIPNQTAFLNFKPPLIEPDIYLRVQSILC